jgi:hypothetical protein
MSVKHAYTENEAQALHDYRLVHSAGHDRVSCWCCCTDCDFDFDAIMGVKHEQETATGAEEVPQRAESGADSEEPGEPETFPFTEEGRRG